MSRHRAYGSDVIMVTSNVGKVKGEVIPLPFILI